MSQPKATFGTSLNCMDGRAVESTIAWMKKSLHLDYVDVLTEPGMDGFLQKMTDEQVAWLKHKLDISIMHHGSRVITVVGHDDCAGNPVSAEKHRANIVGGVERIHSLVRAIDPSIAVTVIGLWVYQDQKSGKWVVDKQ